MDAALSQELKDTTTKNIFLLTFRNFGIQAISTIGFFILTIILGPAEVGLFAVVAEAVGILGYFSDLGLASALIQQKEEVKKEELQTTFIIQQILVAVGIILAFFLYRRYSTSKGYGYKEEWIFYSLCFAFFAASLKTIPSVLLERKLNFKVISSVDIAENVVFYLVAVIFALLGFGAISYAFASFLRSFLGLIMIYRLQPWPFGISFDPKSAKKLFRFGIPFQLNSFIAVAKDRLSNLLVAAILGRESFGLLSWAQKGPRVPLSFMDAVMRVTFPTFSRIQNQTDLLKRSLQKSLFYISFFIFPSLVMVCFIAPDIIQIIPKYNKWFAAIVPVYFYSMSYAIAAVTTPITNAFNAVGKITLTTRFMIMWTILTWLLYPWLSYRFSYIGTSMAVLIVGCSSFFVWLSAYKEFNVNVLKSILHPTIGSFIMLLSLILISFSVDNNYLALVLKLITGTSAYLLYQLTFSRRQITWFINQIPWLNFIKR